MIVETSALAAIFFQEEGWEGLAEKIRSQPSRMSAVSWLEVNIVVTKRFGVQGREDLAYVRQQLEIEITSFAEVQSEAAIGASLNFGKGNHPAGLNFGDCASYALSSVSGEPLLFIGNGFTQTDIVPA